MNVVDRTLAKLSFDIKARMGVYEKLRAASADGISLKAAIDNLYFIHARPGRKSPLRHIFLDWSNELGAGKPFHEAVADWVPSNEQLVLSSADNGQSLVDAFDAIDKQMKVASELRSAVAKAAAMPVLYVLLVLGIIVMVARVLMPELLKSMQREEADAAAPVFMFLMDVVSAAPWLPIALAVATGLALRFIMPFEFPTRKKFDLLFPFNFYRLLQGSAFLMTLAGLQKVGSNELEAVRIIDERGSPWLRARLGPLIEGMEAGKTLGVSADETGYAFPSQKIIDDIMFYENTTQASIAIGRAADRWTEEGKKQAAIIGATLNLLGLLFVAGAIVWVVFSVGSVLAGSTFFNGNAF